MDYVALFVIVTYLAVVTAIGMTLARKTTSARQWAVGGGGMGIAMIAVGVAGTRIGGAGTYGVAGDVVFEGVWNLWWYGISTFLAMAVVGIFFAIPYRRLKLQTVGEVFTIRFNSRRNQVLTSLCVQTEYLIVNIIEAYVIGIILASLTPLDMGVTVFIAAFILVSYISLGGLWGASVTNLIHCGVILVGLLCVGLIGIYQIGGWGAVTENVNRQLTEAGKDPDRWWSFHGLSWGAVIGMIFSVVVHTPAASVYTNFSTAARNERTLLPGFLIAGVIGALMPFLAGLIGILTVANYGFGLGLTGYRNVTHLATEISPWIGGLAVAAVLAAVISSGGPILLSSSTMFVRDWLPFTQKYNTTEKLRLYRITTVIYGFLAAILAYIVAQTDISLLDLLLFGFAMVVPPAIAVGYLLYWKRTTEAGAYWGMALGYGGGLIWFALIKFAQWINFEVGDDETGWRAWFHFFFIYKGEGIDPSYATTFIPLLAVPIVSLLTHRRAEDAEHFYDVVAGKTEMADEDD